MSKNRYSARVDKDQPDVVKQLRKAGYKVEVGHDDFLIYGYGYLLWVEWKSGGAISKKTDSPYSYEITDSEKKRLEDFGTCYIIAWKIEQIYDWFEQHLRHRGPNGT